MTLNSSSIKIIIGLVIFASGRSIANNNEYDFKICVTNRASLPVSNARVYKGLSFLFNDQTRRFSRVSANSLAQSNSNGIIKLKLKLSDYGKPLVIVDESTEEMSCVWLKPLDAKKDVRVELQPPIRINIELKINKNVASEEMKMQLMPRSLCSDINYHSGVLSYTNVNIGRDLPLSFELICPFYASDMLLCMEAEATEYFSQKIPKIEFDENIELGTLELKVKDGYHILNKRPPSLEISEWVKGKPVNLDSLQNKVVLLDFWALWCSPCIRGFPELIRLHNEYENDGLVIIAVHHNSKNMNDILNADPSIINIKKIPFRIAVDKSELAENNTQEGLTFRGFDVTKLPTKVLINREGIVDCYDPGNLETRIKTLLYVDTENNVSKNTAFTFLLYVQKNKIVILCCIGLLLVIAYITIRKTCLSGCSVPLKNKRK